MPRKQTNPDIGQVPCPKCGLWVPLRRRTDNKYYEVCKPCNAEPAEYYLENAIFYQNGTPPAGTPALGTPASPDPLAQSKHRAPDPAALNNTHRETLDSGNLVVIPPRPVPERIRQLQQAGKKSAQEQADTPEESPAFLPESQDDTPEPELNFGPSGPGFLSRFAQGVDQGFDEWFKESIEDPEL